MRMSFRNDETRNLWSLKNLLIGLMSLENAHGAVVRPNGSLRNIKTFPFRTKQKYFWIGRLSLTDRKASVTSREEAHIPRKRCGRMEEIASIFNGGVEIKQLRNERSRMGRMPPFFLVTENSRLKCTVSGITDRSPVTIPLLTHCSTWGKSSELFDELVTTKARGFVPAAHRRRGQPF